MSLFGSIVHWTEDHWKPLVTAGAATAVFAGVTLLTGGLGAPVLVALGSGGFASGVAGSILGALLAGQTPTVKDALIAGAVTGVVSVATLGVGRLLAPVIAPVVAPATALIPEAVSAAVPGVVRVSAANAVLAGGLGATTQVAANALAGRPLGEGVRDATLITAASGAIAGPVLHALAPSKTPGIVNALEGGARSRTEVPAARDAASTDPVLDAAPLVAHDPDLEATLAQLQQDGWTIRYSSPGEGSWANLDSRTIFVEPSGEPAHVAGSLAHESSHAASGPNEFTFDARDGFSGFEKAYTRARVLDEGRAVLAEARFRGRLLARGGQDIWSVEPYASYLRDPAFRSALETPGSDDARALAVGDYYTRNGEPAQTSGHAGVKTYRDLYALEARESWEREWSHRVADFLAHR